MRQVTIQSGDGQGVNGLDMDFTDEIGPLLVKDVTVKGFQYGIVTGYRVNSQTFENIHLENQSVYGFWNFSQVVNIRNLTSSNAVTAVYNGVGNAGHMVLIDSTLNGISGTASNPAIRNDGTLLARNIITSGYQSSLQSGNDTLTGNNISEFVSGEVVSQFPSPAQTLNLPIKETPDVPWDDPVTNPWANVVAFGAIPDDGLDDTAAIQSGIDSGNTTVYFPAGGTFEIQGTILVRNNVRRILGTEGRVIAMSSNAGFKVIDGTSPIVAIERLNNGYEFPLAIDNASPRTLVLKNLLGVTGNMTGSGDIFIEDVGGENWHFGQQNIWARQFNVENEGTHITNNGGKLWILGLKTERGGTLIDTRGGGTNRSVGWFSLHNYGWLRW
jgi:Pectate lyase superfamily protein